MHLSGATLSILEWFNWHPLLFSVLVAQSCEGAIFLVASKACTYPTHRRISQHRKKLLRQLPGPFPQGELLQVWH